MQEVSLFAGISADKKEKIIQILECLAGQKQNAFMEWYLIYAPPSDGVSSNRPDLYLRLCTPIVAPLSQEELRHPRDWVIALVDAPDTGIKLPVTSRLRLQSRVLRGDILTLLEELGYTFRFAYALHGTRYIYEHCIMTLTQTMIMDDKTSTLISVDHAKGWLLEATVNVEDVSDRVLMENAVEELGRLRKILQGVCCLEPADDYRLK
ncbi:hypothetical protein PCANB_000496 [Pneumocystis canis]|nr:hypothetical protein PCK1_000475 [Pneumocystis canis]KAG5437783.1 hypothetical protein PCANB_000496 [Pneumocystis canis]